MSMTSEVIDSPQDWTNYRILATSLQEFRCWSSYPKTCAGYCLPTRCKSYVVAQALTAAVLAERQYFFVFRQREAALLSDETAK